MREIGHFIGGKTVAGSSGRTGAVRNPGTGGQAAKVALASADELRKAVAVAANAFPDWAATPPLMRARVMFKFKELIEKHRDELAKIITSEHGKIFEDAKGSVTRGLEVVEFACG